MRTWTEDNGTWTSPMGEPITTKVLKNGKWREEPFPAPILTIRPESGKLLLTIIYSYGERKEPLGIYDTPQEAMAAGTEYTEA